MKLDFKLSLRMDRPVNKIKDYKTRQRETILNFLRENDAESPSANEIYNALCAAGEQVGRTTVYRALDKMAERGELLVFPAEDKNGARYQLRSAACAQQDHIHLKCGSCGRVIHLDCTLVSEFSGHLLKSHGFAIDRSKTVIYGLCAECAGKVKAHEQ